MMANHVQEFSPTGALLNTFGTDLIGPGAVAVDASGDVWVLNARGRMIGGGRVVEFSPAGALIGQFGSSGSEPGQIGWAFGLALSGGNVYVAEYSNERVQEFTTAGTFVRQFATGTRQWGIATDPTTGNLDVGPADTYKGDEYTGWVVQEFSPSGVLAGTLRFSTPPGGQELLEQEGIAVGADGQLAVADTGHNAVRAQMVEFVWGGAIK